MYIFRKYRDKENNFDHTHVVIACTAEHANDVANAFKDFLLACGFYWVEEVKIIAKGEGDE